MRVIKSIIAGLCTLTIATSSQNTTLVQVDQVNIEGDRELAKRSRPTIGVLTIRYCKENLHYVLPTYVRWLNKAGADVVAIDSRASEAEQKKLFNSLNGVVFPGASNPGSEYTRTMRRFIKWAEISARNGNPFAVVGTCYGFQRMANAFAGQKVVGNIKDTDSKRSVKLLNSSKSFRMTNGLSSRLVNALETMPVVYQNHFKGITPLKFAGNKKLSKAFRMVGTSVNTQGKEYVTMYEGKTLPFYAFQHHPETFKFIGKGKTNLRARQINMAMGKFVVAQARKNTPNVKSAKSKLIQKSRDLFINKAYFFLGKKGPFFVPKQTKEKLTRKSCSKSELDQYPPTK
uniref:folate gamma-glutamyl hydrolase n=1 Tax=Mucochytrium quahogii TaxID=96639 RepID=A0A7S2W7R9_9STRA|mmetsp:Transcript_16202/g.35194  ORF Transcript_16202/g.35194 Transcript_16202/m.35194 type:complete len:344 (+) Transcript_16202:44-1075(+)